MTPIRVNLVAGHKDTGEPVLEEVLVSRLADGDYRLLVTPGLVLGVAAGDTISVDEESHLHALVARGGNIAVHVYGNAASVLSVADDIRALGGWHDGGLKEVLTVYTVPYRDGFRALEAILNGLVHSDPAIEWYYGNVYAADEVTPLRWWDEDATATTGQNVPSG
ncbi:DUF4265 domain-containing protein [Longispora sp. K20-0274]|uniref:DUF4265 domain-containing protein n=1 Tax=Longispora sp. K20-0274 TaxID=3088255 RepID=UPI003999C75B